MLAAALALFARQGPAATTVDQVAKEAGLTKGAVYSNFATKEELFAAAVERLPYRTASAFVPGGARTKAEFRAAMRDFAAIAWSAQPPDEAIAFLHELYGFALRHDVSRPALAGWIAGIFDEAVAETADDIVGGGLDLEVSVRDLWVIGQTLIEGLFVRRALNPELIDEALFVKAVALLAELATDD